MRSPPPALWGAFWLFQGTSGAVRCSAFRSVRYHGWYHEPLLSQGRAAWAAVAPFEGSGPAVGGLKVVARPPEFSPTGQNPIRRTNHVRVSGCPSQRSLTCRSNTHRSFASGWWTSSEGVDLALLPNLDLPQVVLRFETQTDLRPGRKMDTHLQSHRRHLRTSSAFSKSSNTGGRPRGHRSLYCLRDASHVVPETAGQIGTAPQTIGAGRTRQAHDRPASCLD